MVRAATAVIASLPEHGRMRGERKRKRPDAPCSLCAAEEVLAAATARLVLPARTIPVVVAPRRELRAGGLVHGLARGVTRRLR